MSTVIVEYDSLLDGVPIRAVFSSVEEAHAQAAHDLAQPGHLNPVRITVDGEDAGVKMLKCGCPLCVWHRLPHRERVKDMERPFAEQRNPWR